MINYSSKEINIKIVYYGCELSGKTTCLKYIHSKTSPDKRGKLTSLATEGDRTIFFDLLPIDVGIIGGYKVRVGLYTVPGQSYYLASRKLVLTGAHGVVFVVDSQKERLNANIDSLQDLERNLIEQNSPLDVLPFVIMYNKRDLPNILPVSKLEEVLNYRKVPSFESVAVSGPGVFDALKKIISLTVIDVANRYKLKIDSKSQTKDEVAIDKKAQIPEANKQQIATSSPTDITIKDSKKEDKSELSLSKTESIVNNAEEDDIKDKKPTISTTGIVLENAPPIPDLVQTPLILTPQKQAKVESKINKDNVKLEIKNILVKNKLNSEDILQLSTELLQVVTISKINATTLSASINLISTESTPIIKALLNIVDFLEKNKIEFEIINSIPAFLLSIALNKRIEEILKRLSMKR